MITEAIIKSIDYNKNSCTVRLPLYETVQNLPEVIVPAKIAVYPGSYNNYKVDDAVWVAFEQEKVHKPIIIGKIFKSAADESLNSGGIIKCKSFTCTDNAQFPDDTTFGKSKVSITKILKSLKEVESMISGKITSTIISSKFSNILTIINGATTYKLVFDTNKNYITIQDFFFALSKTCNSSTKILPVLDASGNDIYGIYFTDNKLYGMVIGQPDAILLFDTGQTIGDDYNISLVSTEVSRI